jgi:hypothetical protein
MPHIFLVFLGNIFAKFGSRDVELLGLLADVCCALGVDYAPVVLTGVFFTVICVIVSRCIKDYAPTCAWCLNHFIFCVLHHINNFYCLCYSSIPCFILHDLNIATDYEFSCDRVIHLVSFCVFRIPNKYTFLSFVF